MFNFPFKTTRSFWALCSALLLTVALPAESTRDYSVSDSTTEVLTKYRVPLDANNYDAALAIIDAQIPKVEAGSYDLALLYQIKAQIYLQQGDFPKSIDPLERTIALSDAKTPPFHEEKVVREFIYLLAQLYYTEATQTKNPTVAVSYFDKADKAMARWVKITPKPTSDALAIYSQILFSWAQLDPDHPDLELIKRSMVQIDAALHLAIHPQDKLFLLKLICLQQLGKNAEAAEVLEEIVKQKQDSSAYWQQLAAFYLSTEQQTRAIITYERAQSHGFMNTPKENIILISIYFNLGQFEKAAELLEVDLRNGHVDNILANWELLAFCYQQLDRPIKGIEALKDATKAFPKSGQMEYMIAQAYRGLEQREAALRHAQFAVAKGNLTKPHSTYMFLAYIAYELKKYDVALNAAHKAAELPEGAKDKQTRDMIKAIEETIKEREAKKNKA